MKRRILGLGPGLLGLALLVGGCLTHPQPRCCAKGRCCQMERCCSRTAGGACCAQKLDSCCAVASACCERQP